MKYLKKFEKFENQKINEDIGVALFAGMSIAWLGLAPHLKFIYQKVKDWWKGKKLTDKYKETGKKEIIVTKLPEEISVNLSVSEKEKKDGAIEIEVTQYKDDFDNIYWGYDHIGTDKDGKETAAKDMYTAMFKEEDYGDLKAFLQDSDRFSKEGSKSKAPKPIEIIYREDLK